MSISTRSQIPDFPRSGIFYGDNLVSGGVCKRVQSDLRPSFLLPFVLVLAVLVPGVVVSAQSPPAISQFLDLGSSDARAAAAATTIVAAAWRDGYASMLIDMARLLPGPRRAEDATSIAFDDGINPTAAGAIGLTTPGSPVRARLIRLLEQYTHQRFGDDLARWRQWMWARPYQPHPDYMAFKAAIYEHVDPKMRRFFTTGTASIRLDEIDWGGVGVNGIPPLVNPRIVSAAQASWLKDEHWIFGVEINGEARAYPKRILAWHEMALDRLGGVDLTLVYCTLCGTAIPYESRVGGQLRTFGTSGLLYRSNKLMFDSESGSLWSTLEGRPVVGPLVGSGLTLTARPIVTTRWSEWRRQHPQTTVVSLETGFTRDYSEGAAYRDYFSTDRLMFRTPFDDKRLPNKEEVLGVLVPAAGGGRQALAFPASALGKKPVTMTAVEDRSLVVITTSRGANRVYDAGRVTFTTRVTDDVVADAGGRRWRVTEEALVPEATGGDQPHPRIAAFRAFWFGWHAQFPDTLLIK